jgi:Acetyltransferase (GNAT) domain
MRLRRFDDSDAARWDAFVPTTAQGCFLHTRRFLGYHGERFADRSYVFEDERGALRAVFPAALAPDDSTRVVSHPGVTHAGLLHAPRCQPGEIHAMLAALCAQLAADGHRSLLFRMVPPALHRVAVQADVHALWQLGALVVRRDLWNAFSLRDPRVASSRHPRNLHYADVAGLVVGGIAREDVAGFHALLSEVLAQRHGQAPVHSLAQLLDIDARCPGDTAVWGCRDPQGRLVAGAWVFHLHAGCWHVQYMASNEAGRASNAMDRLLEGIIEAASAAGVGLLSMGASTVDGGRRINDTLFAFKARLGAGSLVQDFLEIGLH